MGVYVTSSERGGPGSVPCPERTLGVAAAKLLAVLAVPLIAGATAVAGWGGALGSAAGLLLVLGLFGLSGLALGALPAAGPSLVVRVSLVALGVRLVGYLVALAALATVDGLHRPSLAAATAVAIVVTLAHELRTVQTTPGFFRVDAGAGARLGATRQGAG